MTYYEHVHQNNSLKNFENEEQYSRDHSHDHYCHLQFQFRKISFIIQFQISIIIINKN